MSERCPEVKRYQAMRVVRLWERPVLALLYWYQTKIKKRHRMLAGQTRLIRRFETHPVEIQCECVAGHDGSHLHGGIMWWENRMLVYGTRSLELGFGKAMVDQLEARRVFAEKR